MISEQHFELSLKPASAAGSTASWAARTTRTTGCATFTSLLQAREQQLRELTFGFVELGHLADVDHFLELLVVLEGDVQLLAAVVEHLVDSWSVIVSKFSFADCTLSR